MLTRLLYAGFSSPSEPMTPLSCASKELIETTLTKLTTDVVVKPKESEGLILS